jgi:hypothetical protein
VIFLAWYTEDQWRMLKRVADDPERLDETYGDWLEAALECESNFAILGQPVTRVFVRIPEWMEWCSQNGRRLDSGSRSAYAAYKGSHEEPRG